MTEQYDFCVNEEETKYVVQTAVTEKVLMCAACDCKIGGEKSERIVCVHTLPLLYQLSLLLADGLAQHTLIELSNMWSKNLEQQISSVK